MIDTIQIASAKASHHTFLVKLRAGASHSLIARLARFWRDFSFWKNFQGFRSKIRILALECLLWFVSIDKNFFTPHFPGFSKFEKKWAYHQGMQCDTSSKLRVFQSKAFLSTSWVTILGSRCFCGQYFFKQKKQRMNKLNKVGIWDIGSLREPSELVWFPMMWSKFFDAT